MTKDIQTPTADRPRRHRRWPFVIGAVVIFILVITILILPSAISTKRGLATVLNYVNGSIKGNIRARHLSLTWAGPTRIDGLEVTDPEGRKVLAAKEVRWSRGMWRILTSAMRFDDLQVDSARLVLYFDDEGTPSVERAVESQQEGSESATQPATTQPSQGLPQPVGRLNIKGTQVRLVRSNGASLDIPSFDGFFDLDTLSNIKGQTKIVFARNSVLLSDFDVRGMVHNNLLSLTRAQGQVKLTTDGAVDIRPWAIFAADNLNTGGMLKLKMDAQFRPGEANANFEGQIAGLRAGRTKNEKINPIDVNATGQLRTEGNKISAQTILGGQAGRIQSDFVYIMPKQPLNLSWEKMMDMFLQGEKHPLPDFSLNSRGTIDIPRLARAVPAILTLRPGVEITNGNIEIRDISIVGENKPRAAGRIDVTEVVARGENRTIHLEPILSRFNTFIEYGTGLVIREGRLRSEVVNVDVEGTLKKLTADFKGNLSRINRVGEVFRMFSVDATGILNGQLNLTQTQSNTMRIGLNMKATDFRYATGQGRLEMRDAWVRYDGSLNLGEHRIQHLEVHEARANIDNNIHINGFGWYNPQRGGIQADVVIERAELDYLVDRISQINGGNSGDYRGTLRLRTQVRQVSDRQPFVITGDGQINRFVAGSGNSAFREDRIDFSTGRILIDSARNLIALNATVVRSPPLSAHVDGTIYRYATRPRLDLSGRYEARWDRITDLIHQMAPATIPTVNFSGRSASPFTVTGLVENPVVRGLNAGWAMNWSSGQVYGLVLGQAEVSPRLRSGRLILPRNPIPASEGILQLGGFIDLVSPTPILRIPESVPVLQNIHVDKKFGIHFLSYINPIFIDVVEMDGTVSLNLRNLELPLSQAIKTSGRGQGYLDMTHMRMVPGGFLGEIMKLGDLPFQEMYSVQMSGVNFIIEGGRIRYRDFRVAFGREYDMIFSGSVGFDDSLDMVVSVPLRPPLLQRFDIRPEIFQMTDVLRSLRILIPLGGTREHPRLDLSKVDLRQILREELKGVLLQPGKDIDELLAPLTPGLTPKERGKALLNPLLPGQAAPATQPGPTEKLERGLLDPLLKDEKK